VKIGRIYVRKLLRCGLVIIIVHILSVPPHGLNLRDG